VFILNIGKKRGEYKILVKKPEGNGPLGRYSRSWRIILRWISGSGMEGKDWIDLAKKRDKWQPLVNAEMNFRVS
jgi:hypothetical protein